MSAIERQSFGIGAFCVLVERVRRVVMATADTADLELGNASPDVTAPLASPPESAEPPREPESAGSDAPETEAGLDELDGDAFDNHPKVKARLAREAESHRRQLETTKQDAEREATVKERQREADYVLRGGLARAVENLVRTSTANNGQFNPQDLQDQVVAPLWRQIDQLKFNEFATALDAQVPAEYRIPKADVAKLDRAKAGYGSTHTSTDILTVIFDIAVKAKTEGMKEELRKEVLKEQAAADAAKGKVDGLRSAEQARNGQSGPTQTAGGGGGTGAALNSKELDKAYDSNSWRLKPAAERQKLVAAAKAEDLRNADRFDQSRVDRVRGR